MLKSLSILIVLKIIAPIAFGQHDHSHTKDTSFHIRDKWGDFDPGQLIKYKPVDYHGTPVERIISKKGELKDEYGYVADIDVYSIAYESDGLMVSGYMVRPKSPGNYPCIIYNRGGNRDMGQLVVGTAVMYMGLVASKGYIVIASNYRGNGGSEGEEEFGGADVQDVLNLIPALGQVEGADTSRIGMLGISRGGMMTYLALRQTPRIRAAAVIGGMSDMATTIQFRPEMEEHVFAELIPNYKTATDSLIRDRSVNQWADQLPAETKLLILHGEKDERVSVEEARGLHKILSETDHSHSYVEFKNDNHGLMKHHTDAFSFITDWFDQYVRDGDESAPSESMILVE